MIEESKLKIQKYPNGKDIILGNGSFGTVYLGKYAEKEVAVKEFDVTNDPDLKKIALEEADIQTNIKHPNIVKYYGYFVNSYNYNQIKREFVTLISEYYPKGTLFECLYSEKPEFSTRLKWALQIAHALEYLHTLNIVHRDLKPENILISHSNDAALTDFGYSKRLMTNSSRRHQLSKVGTILWTAPEIFLGLPYDNSVDTYAYGILLFEILYMKRPYSQEECMNEKNFEKRIIGEKIMIEGKETVVELRPNPKVSEVDMNLVLIMKKCWDSDPSKRPSWKEIIKFLEN
jgi:serine/threonine protein kinase